jgi:AAA family ATP:ADP antiporter
MFGYFFLIITTFWILKPIKKSAFVGFYDHHGINFLGRELDAAQAELIAKIVNMVVAALAVAVFSALSHYLRREKLALVFSAFFALTLVGYSFVIHHPSDAIVWSFYLYGDLYSTLMVATFFAFLNDSVTPSAAKRLYPVIVLGGVAGGAFGSSSLRAWIDSIDSMGWIWICVALTIVVGLLAASAGRLVRRGVLEGAPALPAPTAESAASTEGNGVLGGARLVFRSRYLLSLAAIIGLYEIVSTIMDYQFTATVAHYLDGPEIDRQFATVFTITNGTSLVVQLVATSYVMNRFRLVTALLVTPLIVLGAEASFLVMPALWVGSMLNTSDNAFNYSINQSAREALYTPTTRDEKYKAKAFIDMFVQRFAKTIAVGMSLVLTSLFTDFSTVRWLSFVVALCVAVWLWAAHHAGHQFHKLTTQRDSN